MTPSLSEHRAVGGPILSSQLRTLCADGAFIATVAFVGVLFLVSPLLLEHFGVSYITSGGGPASKVHPATLIAALALALRCFATPRPVATATRLLLRDSGIVLLLAATGIAGCYAAAISHTPFTPVIDTFVLPVLCLVLLRDLSPANRRWLAYFVIALFCVNAAMAIIELFRGTHFITVPLAADSSPDPTRSDAVFDWRAEINIDWRAVALLGHPLVNGMEVATFMICLGARGANWLPPIVRLSVLALQLVAMGAFGARASLVLAVATLAFYAVRGIVAHRRVGSRIPPRLLAIGILATGAALVGMLVLYQIGFFDRLIERFSDDAGSAKTRLTMFELFKPFDWSNLLLGPDQDVVATWQRLHGLEFGIESSWVGLALTYGLVVTAILIAGLATFVRSVLRSSGDGAFEALAVFLICASVMASMSGKTISFGMAVVTVLLLLPPPDDRSRRRGLPKNDTSRAPISQDPYRSATEGAAFLAAGYSHAMKTRFKAGGVL